MAIKVMIRRFDACPIANFNARSPATLNNLINALPSFSCISIAQGIHTRHEAWILHHEGHELRGIATNAEKFQTVLFNESSESRMSS